MGDLTLATLPTLGFSNLFMVRNSPTRGDWKGLTQLNTVPVTVDTRNITPKLCINEIEWDETYTDLDIETHTWVT